MLRFGRPRAPAVPDAERDRILALAVEKTVDALTPLAIYAFGSIVTGPFDEASDVDLLVVLETDADAGRAWRKYAVIRRALPCALDLVAMSREDFERKRVSGGVAHVAATEGRLVYARNAKERTNP